MALPLLSSRPDQSDVSSTSLRRSLGFWQVALSGVGVILGAGIYALNLPWLAARRRTPASGGPRAAEILIPSVAFVLCTWLLRHAGVTSIVAALALALVMLAAPSSGRIVAMYRRRNIGETR